MAKIIYYDFRWEEREKELEAIQERSRERMLKFIEDNTYFTIPEVNKAIYADLMLKKQLEKERDEWYELCKNNNNR